MSPRCTIISSGTSRGCSTCTSTVTGRAAELAQKLKPALDLIGKGAAARRPRSAARRCQRRAAINTAKLARSSGTQGEQNGAVYKITRRPRRSEGRRRWARPINARMGLNTWAAFTGTDEKAAIAGDVAMLESEVTPVLKALRKNGLDVVAIHHHMTSDAADDLSSCTTGAPGRPTSSRPASRPRSTNSASTAPRRLDEAFRRLAVLGGSEKVSARP